MSNENPGVIDDVDEKRKISTFIAAFADGDISVYDEKGMSELVDMADCNPVPFTLYANVDGNLVPLTIGKKERFNDDQTNPFYYASSPVLLPDGTEVGRVVHTDH